jgi:hypothetical protein
VTNSPQPLGKVRIGIGLLSFTAALLVVGFLSAFARWTDSAVVKVLIPVAAFALIAVLWIAAVRNGAGERTAVARLRAAHPGAFVERVTLWSLPDGLAGKDLPMHFIVADPEEIRFEAEDGSALARVPVAEIGFVDLVRAKDDRAGDKALTIIFGDEQDVVQVFPDMNLGLMKLRSRVRKAIGWPDDGTPAH